MEQLFPVGQRREMRFRIYSYRNAGKARGQDLIDGASPVVPVLSVHVLPASGWGVLLWIRKL